MEADANTGASAEQAQSEWLSLDWQSQRLYSFTHEYCSTPRPQGAASAGRPKQDNFPKGALWSPDGACLLTCAEDSVFRVYDLLPDAMECAAPAPANEHGDSFWPSLRVKETEAVYDFCWYPRMSAADPASAVFASTSRSHPLHLWSAVDGSLRCTYRAFDDKDEIVAALSACFSADGASLIAGYNKEIRVFRTDTPGRDCASIRTLNKRHRVGQAGLVSALAANPWHRNLLAAGCYDRSVGLYDFTTREQLLLLRGHAGGVTCVRFSPDGNFLYTGARKDDQVLCWDVRGASEGPLYALQRSGQTNQRVSFDIEPCGRTLATGGTDGFVRAFNLSDGAEVAAFEAGHGGSTVSGVSVHPSAALVATSFGCRRFEDAADEEDDDEQGGRKNNRAEAAQGGAPQATAAAAVTAAAPSSGVLVWRCGFQRVVS